MLGVLDDLIEEFHQKDEEIFIYSGHLSAEVPQLLTSLDVCQAAITGQISESLIECKGTERFAHVFQNFFKEVRNDMRLVRELRQVIVVTHLHMHLYFI